VEGINESTLVVLGVAIFSGTVGAGLFQRIRMPQVVGYIIIGLIIGRSGFGIVADEELLELQSLNLFALAVIGFLVGGELHFSTFKKYGRQFTGILLGEGLAAFVIVAVLTGTLIYFVVGNVTAAVAGGLIFGSIASATDPASTVDVLWEYRGRGVLTTTIIAIVALDDALAMALYGFGTSLAQLVSGQDVSWTSELIRIVIELPGAVVLGIVAGLLTNAMLRWQNSAEKGLAISVGILLLVIGISVGAHMDVILATMALGVTLTNLAPLRSSELFKVVRSFSTPIYVLFFVLVGARLSITGMPAWLWGIVGLYLAGRTAGKMAGAWFGARLAGAEPVVQRYTGLGLFAQGGIAVGLSIMASQHLGNVEVTDGLLLGDMVVFSITASTFIIQLIGPSLIKLSIQRAGEIGRDVTEDDVIEGMFVDDALDPDIETISINETIKSVFDKFSRQPYLVLPVVDMHNRPVGQVTLESLKQVFASQDTWEWLLVNDVTEPIREHTDRATPLKQAITQMRDTGIDQLFVVDDQADGAMAGVLTQRRAQKALKHRLVQAQTAQEAA